MNNKITTHADSTLVRFPGYGPPPPNLQDLVVRRRWDRIIEWLAAHQLPIGKLEYHQLRFPGQAPDAWRPYARFRQDGYEDALHDGTLMMATPHVTLTELQVHFLVGDPSRVEYLHEETPTPPPPPAPPSPPADPVGGPIAERPGRYYSAPGDTSPAGAIHTREDGSRYRKVVQGTPWASMVWWERIV